MPPKQFCKNRKFHVSQCLSRKFSDFRPPYPPGQVRKSDSLPRRDMLRSIFSVARRGFFSQGLFIGPMSSFPVIFIIRFGVNALHPTRYRPPAMSSGHPQKRTTMVGGPLGKATYGREKMSERTLLVLASYYYHAPMNEAWYLIV